jgi:hypothetical protein
MAGIGHEKLGAVLYILLIYFAVLGFELRASTLTTQALYHLSHTLSPFLLAVFEITSFFPSWGWL